jgi:hypothetical protein
MRNDRRIEEAEPGGTSITGRVTARLAAGELLAEALADMPVDLTLGFEASAGRAVEFCLPRTFLSRPRRRLTGRAGCRSPTTCAPRPTGSGQRSPSRSATASRATRERPPRRRQYSVVS